MKEAGSSVARQSSAHAVVWSVVQRHRTMAGALVGLILPLARVVNDLLGVPIADTVELALLTALYFLSLAALCWPWTNYALALKLSLVSAIALICIGTVNVFLRDVGDAKLVPWIVPVGVILVFAGFFGVAFAVLSGLVFMRMRYWPVYGPGHCPRCGYSLIGLPSDRCPECGTPVVRQETSGVGI